MELVIDSLAAGGDGVGRAPDGRVVFVPFTAPGDRVRVRVTDTRKRYLRAKVEMLLAPGPDRTDPVCPVFGSCGGCSWQHVRIPAQLEAKRRIVEDALQRIGGLPFAGEIEVVASPREYGYRARTRVLRQGGRTGFRRRRSHAVQPVTRCPVLTPALDAELRALAGASAPSAPDEEIELGGGDLVVGGDLLRVSPGVFFQANEALHEALAGAVVEAAGTGGCALEVFAGAGFFTLALARRFRRVVAVESDPTAVLDLRHNLARCGAAHVEVVGERLEGAFSRLADVGPDAIVLDPPRTGLPAGAPERLAGLGAERIVYLSCDPATLARDVAEFARLGHRLREVRAFDLFPQTPHVEVLATLHSRGGVQDRGPLPRSQRSV